MKSISKQVLAAVTLLALLTLGGCAKKWKCEVESDTCWSGAFVNRTVDGCGNKEVELPGDPPHCITVQKLTPGGFLRIRLKETGGWFLDPGRTREAVTTTAAYGIVVDCSQE